jgi:hypothetical protein
MTRSQEVFPCLISLAIVSLQLACGDSSGPGNVATTITAHSSTEQTAAPGTQVSELPSVIVFDQNGAVLGGAHVTFAVTSGGGSITGANATTSPTGIATVGSWTLGTSLGTNTLTATTGSLPAVTFTAIGGDPCEANATHTIGTTTSGGLTVSDCKFADGTFVDFYAVTISTDGTYVFNQKSGVFDTFLILYLTGGDPIAVNDDFGTGSDSRIKAIIPAGNYTIGANSYDISTGSYTLTSATDVASITNCETVFVVRGSSSAQTLETSDCSRDGFYEDRYFIYLTDGQAITAAMNSSSIDSYLAVYRRNQDLTDTILAQNDNRDGTTTDAQILFTAPSSGFYFIAATSSNAGAIGGYSFSVR